MIIQRYLLLDILRHFAAILGLILVIFVASRLVDYLAEAAAGALLPGLILTMLALSLLATLGMIIPLCFFLAVYLSVNRLQRENEMVAMWNAGFGRRQVALSALALGGALALVVLLLTLLVAPWAERRILDIEARAEEQADILGLAAGRFKELSRGRSVIYVESLSDDGKRMENVFLQLRRPDGTAVLTADTARLETDPDSGDRFVVFDQGMRYTGEPGSLAYTTTAYRRYGVRMEEQEGERALWRSRAMGTAALFASEEPHHQAEWQWRLSPALSLFSLPLLAVYMVRTGRRASYYAGLLTAVAAYFAFNNVVGIARSLMKRDALSPWIGLWWVHLLLLLVVGLLATGGRPDLWWRQRRATARREARGA